jgi:hypothetical protein
LALGIAGIAGGSAISTTLMACYGAPCANDDCSGGWMPTTDAETHDDAQAPVEDAGAGDDGAFGDAQGAD